MFTTLSEHSFVNKLRALHNQLADYNAWERKFSYEEPKNCKCGEYASASRPTYERDVLET